MLLSNIFQQKFPILYFDEGVFTDFLSTILNEMKKKRNGNSSKEKEEKKYYDSILKQLVSIENVDFNNINIFENDFDILDRELNSEIIKSLPEEFANVDVSISIDNYVDGNINILTIADTPGLYLSKSVLPFIYNQIPFFPIDEFNIKQDDFFKFCFNSGNFKDENTIEEIIIRYTNITNGEIDEDGLDIFLFCLEQLLNINLIIVSNKFIGCDNCLKYFFTSSNPKRNIIEGRNCYFMYRYINHTNKAIFYKIDFLNIQKNSILDNYSDFSIKRLIRKYKENYELNIIPKVTVEPTDNEQELPIIEIEIDEKKIQLLLGSTYNLYTTDYKLVGKMDLIDINKNSGICNIQWIDKYPQKLL